MSYRWYNTGYNIVHNLFVMFLVTIHVKIIPRAPMKSIVGGQHRQSIAEIPIKTKVIWVLGIKNTSLDFFLQNNMIYIYIWASIARYPPPPPTPWLWVCIVAPQYPSPPVVWVVVGGGGGGGGRSCICMYMNVYVWCECMFLVFVYDYDMICIWICMCICYYVVLRSTT